MQSGKRLSQNELKIKGKKGKLNKMKKMVCKKVSKEQLVNQKKNILAEDK